MVAITSAMAASFKSELGQAVHNFTTTTGNSYAVALIRDTLGATGTYDCQNTNVGAFQVGTPSLSQLGTDEIQTAGVGIAGYTAGGFNWTAAQNTTPTYSAAAGAVSTSYWAWSANPTWTSASFTSSGAIIYKQGGKNIVAVFSFGGNNTVASGSFTITMPATTAAAAILRIQ